MDNRNPATVVTRPIVVGNHQIDQFNLSNIVTDSTLQKDDPRAQEQAIITAYNAGSKVAWYEPSSIRGDRLRPGELRLGAYNNQPQLAAPDPDNKNIARKLFASPNDRAEYGPILNSTDTFYGARGRFVLNVPLDKYVKAMSGNNVPIIYGPGPHVIDNPNLQFANQVVDSEGFNHLDKEELKDNMIDIMAPYIKHHNFHILYVPAGYYAGVTIGNDPILLPARREPYVFNSPLFKVAEKFIDQSLNYINHGTIHILRVPKGKLATVWIDNKAQLLEHQDEPYVFITPNFKVKQKNENEMFYDATDQVIIHGQIKRLIPHTGEVFVTYDNGDAHVIEPRTQNGGKDSQVIMIDSPTTEYGGFVNTNVQTLVFPSERVKAERRRDNPNASADETSLEVFQTRDSLNVGVKLVVVYNIVNPLLAVRKLGKDGIIPHIETMARVDMGKAIKRCSSQDFMTFWQNKATVGDAKPDGNAPQLHFQDIVKNELAKDLVDYGIELVRLNIESPKIFNQEVSKNMEAQAVLLATTNAKEAALAQQTRITIAESQQKAQAATIQIEQQNAAILSQAQAELTAAKMRADALVIQAKAEKEAKELKGQLYSAYPKVFEMELAQTNAAAIAKAPMMLPANMLPQGMFGNGFSMFTGNAAPAAPSDAQDARQAPRKV